MTNPKKLTKDDFVITSKGNYGKITAIKASTALVKIGYKIHEIELYNLHNVSDGTHVKVEYFNDSGEIETIMLFLKHNQVIYSNENPKQLVESLTNLLLEKTKLKAVIINKISIP